MRYLIVNAFISSKLDFCYTLMYRLPQSRQTIQYVQIRYILHILVVLLDCESQLVQSGHNL